jgi:hypothetical protein
MKTFLVLTLLSVVACQAKEKPVETSQAAAASAAAPVKAEEDCDEKAKAAQKVEIKEESISLTNNTAGCTLE